MKRPGERSVSPRSEPVVAIATAQPSLGVPSTSLSGTNTSSKNTSAKPSSPSRRSTGRTVTPVVARRTALDAGQVAAGVRLGPPLAPRLFARRHLGQDPVLLFGGSELEDGR